MSFMDHVKVYQRWCAAVMSDYELITNQYLSEESWDFQVFKKLNGKLGTIMLHNCAITRGKVMNEHFDHIERVLIQLAKDFWLFYPLERLINKGLDLNCGTADVPAPSIVKLMVAGFFLTYTMHRAWDLTTIQIKIQLDPKDLLAYQYFRKCVEETATIPKMVKYQIKYMILNLIYDESFEFVCESLMTGINPTIRSFCNITRSNVSLLNNEIRVQNSFLSDPAVGKIFEDVKNFEAGLTSLHQQANGSIFRSMDINNRKKLDAISGINSPNHYPNEASATTNSQAIVPFTGFELPRTRVQHMLNATAISVLLSDIPSLSIQNILGHVIIDRAMMSEARKKTERLLRKYTPRNAIEGGETVKKPRPYIEEGGIFGRKNLKDDDKREHCSSSSLVSRESTGNLWNYITTGVFGGLSEKYQRDAN